MYHKFSTIFKRLSAIAILLIVFLYFNEKCFSQSLTFNNTTNEFSYIPNNNLIPHNLNVEINGVDVPYAIEYCYDSTKFSNGIFSAVFCIDISGSTMDKINSTETKLSIEKQIPKSIIILPQIIQYAITTGHTNNTIEIPLTNDKTILDSTLNSITNYGGTNIYNMLMSDTNGIINISKNAIQKRLAIIITDGEDAEFQPSDEQSIIDTCNKYNISLYTFIVNTMQFSYSAQTSLNNISLATGGYYFHTIDTTGKIPSAIDSIKYNIHKYICNIRFSTLDTCSEFYNIKINNDSLTLIDTIIKNSNFKKNNTIKYEISYNKNIINIKTCNDTILTETIKNISSCNGQLYLDSILISPGDSISKSIHIPEYHNPGSYTIYDTIKTNVSDSIITYNINATVDTNKLINGFSYPDIIKILSWLCDTTYTDFTLYNNNCIDSLNIFINGVPYTIHDSLHIILSKKYNKIGLYNEIINIKSNYFNFSFPVEINISNSFDSLSLPDTINLHSSFCNNDSSKIVFKNSECTNLHIKTNYNQIVLYPDSSYIGLLSSNQKDTSYILNIEYYYDGDTIIYNKNIIVNEKYENIFIAPDITYINFDSSINKCYDAFTWLTIYNKNCKEIKIDSMYFDNKSFYIKKYNPIIPSKSLDTINVGFNQDGIPGKYSGTLYIIINGATYSKNYSLIVDTVKHIPLQLLDIVYSNNISVIESRIASSDSINIISIHIKISSSSEDYILKDIIFDSSAIVDFKKITDSEIEYYIHYPEWMSYNFSKPIFKIIGTFLLGIDTTSSITIDEFEINKEFPDIADCLYIVDIPKEVKINYIESCGTTTLRKFINNDYKNITAKLYPNPSTNNIFIQYNNISNVYITDIKGNVLLTDKTNKEINIQSLINGLYYATIKDEQNKNFIILKFVVKK
jgi:hypothetical protein